MSKWLPEASSGGGRGGAPNNNTGARVYFRPPSPPKKKNRQTTPKTPKRTDLYVKFQKFPGEPGPMHGGRAQQTLLLGAAVPHPHPFVPHPINLHWLHWFAYIHVCVCIDKQGKGEITTWWLTGENNAEFPELAPPAVRTDWMIPECELDGITTSAAADAEWLTKSDEWCRPLTVVVITLRCIYKLISAAVLIGADFQGEMHPL